MSIRNIDMKWNIQDYPLSLKNGHRDKTDYGKIS